MAVLKPLEHKQYAHCESGVVSALLRCHDLDLSEPMVFGISGGLTFAYIPFIKMTNMPIISYRMIPGSIIKGAAKNLDVRFNTKRYRDKEDALAELIDLVDQGEIVGLQTSVYWLPYFPPEMRFQFNAHNLIVYGRESVIPFLNIPSGSRLKTSRMPASPGAPLPRKVSCTIPFASIPASIYGRQ
jgi:hypothetical protein